MKILKFKGFYQMYKKDLLINQNGNEIAKLIGPAEWDSEYFVNFIRETLN